MDRLNRYPSAPRNCLRFCQKTSKVTPCKFLRAFHQPSSGTRGPSPSCGFALLSPTSEANRGTLVGVQVSARQTPAQALSMGVVPTQPDLRGKPRPTFRSHPLSALRQGLCLFHGRISYSARPIGPGRQPPSKPRLSPLTSERQYATLGRVCLSLAHTHTRYHLIQYWLGCSARRP